MKKFITTTLPYINGNAHIGHAFEFVLGDIIARRLRDQGHDVKFNVGVDEHGLKIYECGIRDNIPTQAFCDDKATYWLSFLNNINISYDVFYRTASAEHETNCINFWKKQRGLYKKSYVGLYCKGCESFKTESELANGKCPDHPTSTPIQIEETNWFFSMSDYRAELLTWLTNNKYFLTPATKNNELVNLIEDARDISVSRLKKNVPWGVSIPGEEDQVMYCWYSALLNYIFAAGEYWENGETIQLCGPDNIKFQGLMWQAILKSANIKQTDRLLVHGTVLDKNGKKMSKSEHNVIDPSEQIAKYGSDALRYYLAAGLPTYSNGLYSEEQLVNTCNADLADNFGNLVQRVATLQKKFDIPNTPVSSDYLLEKVELAFSQLDSYQMNDAAQTIRVALKEANKYINDKHPWTALKYSAFLNEEELKAEKTRREEAVGVLIKLRGLLLSVSDFYSLYVPETAERAKRLLLGEDGPVTFQRIDRPVLN